MESSRRRINKTIFSACQLFAEICLPPPPPLPWTYSSHQPWFYTRNPFFKFHSKILHMDKRREVNEFSILVFEKYGMQFIKNWFHGKFNELTNSEFTKINNRFIFWFLEGSFSTKAIFEFLRIETFLDYRTVQSPWSYVFLEGWISQFTSRLHSLKYINNS